MCACVVAQWLQQPYLSDLPAFVIPSKKGHMCWIAGLEQHQHGEHLEAVVASIHKVAHEDVVGGRHLTARLEKAQQVMELAMDVATDLHARHGRMKLGA